MPSKPGDPRNTLAWRELRAKVYTTETHCWRCHSYVDQTLDRRHPMGRTVDHLKPIAKGGPGIPPREWLRLAHRRCNSRRGHRPDRPPNELSIDVSKI